MALDKITLLGVEDNDILTRTQAVSNFLQAYTHKDLASLYHAGMEVQVQVSENPDDELVTGVHEGHQWRARRDVAGQLYKPFRIPYDAMGEPHYDDPIMGFDLETHAKGIGLTGWDWKARKSIFVAFDFDALIGHSDKHAKRLNATELQNVRNNAERIPWVTVRRSTSGKGLHLYVFLNDAQSGAVGVRTDNHTEHSALARAILGQMSAFAEFDFNETVDVCGGVMWFWHRKMQGTDGLTLVKRGAPLSNVPLNWKDHVPVIKGNSVRSVRQDDGGVLDGLISQQVNRQLTEEHVTLLKYLQDKNCTYWWDNDRHMLVAHTYNLQCAATDLGMRGIFKTDSQGTSGAAQGSDHNCFAFPLSGGGWTVRRFAKGIKEHVSWTQDENGWTKCHLNVSPTLEIAARSQGGIEHPTRGYVFQRGTNAVEALKLMGINVDVPDTVIHREFDVKEKKGKLVVKTRMETHDHADSDMAGWIDEKNHWVRMFKYHSSVKEDEPVLLLDDAVRHIVSDECNLGWCLKDSEAWRDEPLVHVRSALRAMQYKTAQIESIVGNSILKPWKLVTRPFQPEHPGNREWNRNAPQFRVTVDTTKGLYHWDTWEMVLSHIGKSLDVQLACKSWFRDNAITTGADYLFVWLSCLFQDPFEPLPYLFLHGPQNSGKSILHEAISLLLTSGLKRADMALTNPSSFNGELEGVVLGVVEEVDLSSSRVAYNRIKDWVTSRTLPIHRKMLTPYEVPNLTHWIQCANDRAYCPVFQGDTRITMIHVQPPAKIVPKGELLEKLNMEASDFLSAVLSYELPKSPDRLRLPVIDTSDKQDAQRQSESLLQTFIRERVRFVPGHLTSIAEFHAAYNSWLDPDERYGWTKQRISKELPPEFKKGRYTDSQWYWANVTLDADATNRPPFDVLNEKLVQQENGNARVG